MSAFRILAGVAIGALGVCGLYAIARKNSEASSKLAGMQDQPLGRATVLSGRSGQIPDGYVQPITIKLTPDGFPVDCQRLVDTLRNIKTVGDGETMGVRWFSGLYSVWGYDKHGVFARILVVQDESQHLCEVSLVSDQFGRLVWSADNTEHPLMHEILGQDILDDLITAGAVTVNGQVYYLADYRFSTEVRGTVADCVAELKSASYSRGKPTEAGPTMDRLRPVPIPNCVKSAHPQEVSPEVIEVSRSDGVAPTKTKKPVGSGRKSTPKKADEQPPK